MNIRLYRLEQPSSLEELQTQVVAFQTTGKPMEVCGVEVDPELPLRGDVQSRTLRVVSVDIFPDDDYTVLAQDTETHNWATIDIGPDGEVRMVMTVA